MPKKDPEKETDCGGKKRPAGKKKSTKKKK